MPDDVAPAPSATRRPLRHWALLGAGILTSWLLGAVIVRAGLDWADSFGYGPASEWRYLTVAALALTVACAGTATTVVLFARAHRRINTVRVWFALAAAGIIAAALLIALWRTL